MRIAPSRFLPVVAAAALLLGAGCKSSGANSQPSRRAEAFVRVENRSMLDMTIYVMRSSERRRLGLVNALSTQTLRIPSVLVEGAGILRFQADPIGGSRTPVSQEIMVSDGDVVTLIIPPQ
ncbi:MAG: hypothetical protein M3125_00090 [Gemmatimonadota bacterium]|nr:hypothetical protein [Gemmatimonadota bacterium]